MTTHKICPNLINNVSVLNTNQTQTIFISSSNFDETKTLLTKNKFKFTPYRFANCFSVEVDMEDISFLSDQNSVVYLHSSLSVQTLNFEKDFINLEKLCEGKYYGENQTICFIDTGIHPHFDFLFPKNRLVKFIDLINNNNIPYDDNGHGTFISGIACGNGILSKNFCGIAPKANIISIKALKNDGNSDSNKILDAMQWIYENHKVHNIGVVCMSFGADTLNNTDPLSSGAEALWKRGIVVVAAAGNSGPNKNTIKSPGNNPNIITVGALDTLSMCTAEFSSRGPTIYGHKPDLLAPAVNLTSCSNEFLPYTSMSGTSVAAPIVAGICAIIKNKYPTYTNNQIKQFLLSHSKQITGDVDTEGAGYIHFD